MTVPTAPTGTLGGGQTCGVSGALLAVTDSQKMQTWR